MEVARRVLFAALLLAGSGAAAEPNAAVPAAPSATVQRRYATRAKVGIEFAPGLDIPLKRYLDFGGSGNSYSMQNGPGFGFGLSVMLNSLELRWAYSRLAAGQVVAHIPDNLAIIIQQFFGTIPQRDINVQAPGPLIFNTFSIGYRFAFSPRPRFHLTIPVGGGLVISEPPAFGLVNYALFGFGGYVGLIAEYTFGKFVSVGGGARVSFDITEPDPNLAAAGIAATQNVFDNAVAWLPMVSLTVHARLHY